jgi:L-malate glycosyltransferase
MAPALYRVLHLIHSQQRRGAEVFAAQLASCLEEKGLFQNGLCSLYHNADSNGSNGLPVGELPVYGLGGQNGGFRKLGLDPQLASRLYGALRRFRPHILIAHGSDILKYAACAGFFYRKAATVYRNIGTASMWASSTFKVNLNRMFLGQVDAVVSVSKYTRQDFINVYHFPEERVTFIPNGVDTSDFDSCSRDLVRTQVRQELGLSSTDTVLISVGNLSEEKVHAGLLPVVKDLQRAGLVDHLVLVGDGPLRQGPEQQAAQLGISEQAHFLGRRSDIARVLTAADLFVLPSKTEGMPGVLIEAGLAGLPSVAFDVGGVSEVVERRVTGLLTPPGDNAGLAKNLTALCWNPQLRRVVGDAARRRCREFFSIPKVASQYEELFLRMLSNSSGAKNGRS